MEIENICEAVNFLHQADCISCKGDLHKFWQKIDIFLQIAFFKKTFFQEHLSMTVFGTFSK